MHVSPPLFRQIADRLREQVRALPVGSRIPPEQEIARIWGVSRFTAARAVAEIAGEGLIYRRQGAGSFTAEPPLRRAPGHLLSFTEAAEAAGQVAGHRLLGFGPVPWRPGLPFRSGEALVLLDRLRLVDGVAVARHRSHLAARIVACIGLTEALAAAPGFSLYRSFAQHGFAVSEAAEQLIARPATAEERRLLDLPPGAAVAAVCRQSFAADGTVLDVVDAAYDARRYAYESRLVRQQETPSHAPHTASPPGVDARLGHRPDAARRRPRR